MRGTHRAEGVEVWYQSGNWSGPADAGAVFSSEPTGYPGEGSVIDDSKENLRLEGVIPTAHLPSLKSQHLRGSLSECVNFESVDFS